MIQRYRKDTMTDEEYVRSRWELVESMGRADRGVFRVLIGFGDNEWIYGENRFFYDEDAAWSAAAEFTRQSEEAIRQLTVALNWLNEFGSGNGCDVVPVSVCLGLVGSKLAELKRGMKDQDGGGE